jgi:hypothetical protein
VGPVFAESVALVNQLSRPSITLSEVPQEAQQLGPVLEFLRAALGAAITLVMNPRRELSDLPLKSYYSYALPRFASYGVSRRRVSAQLSGFVIARTCGALWACTMQAWSRPRTIAGAWQFEVLNFQG